MTAHELARILLDGPDAPVLVECCLVECCMDEVLAAKNYTVGEASTTYLMTEVEEES